MMELTVTCALWAIRASPRMSTLVEALERQATGWELRSSRIEHRLVLPLLVSACVVGLSEVPPLVSARITWYPNFKRPGAESLRCAPSLLVDAFRACAARLYHLSGLSRRTIVWNRPVQPVVGRQPVSIGDVEKYPTLVERTVTSICVKCRNSVSVLTISGVLFLRSQDDIHGLEGQANRIGLSGVRTTALIAQGLTRGVSRAAFDRRTAE